MALLDTGTPGTSREIYSEDADDGTRTRTCDFVCVFLFQAVIDTICLQSTDSSQLLRAKRKLREIGLYVKLVD